MSQGSSTVSLGVTAQDEILVLHSADPHNEDPVRPEEKQSVLF